MLLADILKRTTKKSVCSALIIAGIIFALCAFVAIKDRGKEEVTKDEMMTEDAIWQEKSETVATQNQVMDLAEPCPDEGEDEKTLLKEQYDSLRRDYNTAVSEANREIRIYNDFLSELKGYNVDGLPEEYFLKEEMEANFDAFYSNGADFEGLMQELENLSAECEAIRMQYERLPSLAVEKMTNDYNTVVAAYNDLVGKTSVEFIDGLPLKMGSKVIEQVGEDWKENEVFGKLEVLENDIQLALANYSVVSQITDPSEEWVYNRIKNVASIDRWKAVTKENDPNQLLGKEGGYSTCFYFSVKDIPFDSVRGDDLISKGTDAGGAIEVYPSLESAKNRCSYLSQFDNTLLYSGSYVIAGTMVIRTSYRLSTPEQIALTDEIIQAFTEIN